MTKSLAGAIQARLASLYGLDELPAVEDFVRAVATDGREQVVVREGSEDVEIAVLLPAAALDDEGATLTLDELCQVVEGVSHFVLLAERIRTELPTTELELELQAEVDKFVLLASDVNARDLHERLYERVRHLHDEDSELGHRYRTANRLAAQFVRSALRPPGSGHRDHPGLSVSERAAPRLRRFFRAGQEEKIWMALAA